MRGGGFDVYFTTDELLSLIKRGILKLNYSEYLSVDCATDFIQDLTNRVCLLVQEGYVFTFLHRSVQSYFAAFYTTTLSDKDQEKLINEILPEYYIQADFITILAGIERERFNTIYVHPVMKEITSNDNYLSDLLQIIRDFRKSDTDWERSSLIHTFLERFIPILIWLDCNYISSDFNESETREYSVTSEPFNPLQRAIHSER